MTKKELLKGLRYLQRWRKGENIPQPEPKEVTRLIDYAISVIEETEKAEWL